MQKKYLNTLSEIIKMLAKMFKKLHEDNQSITQQLLW